MNQAGGTSSIRYKVTRNDGLTLSIRYEESSTQVFVRLVRSRTKGELVFVRLVCGIKQERHRSSGTKTRSQKVACCVLTRYRRLPPRTHKQIIAAPMREISVAEEGEEGSQPLRSKYHRPRCANYRWAARLTTPEK